MQDRNPYASPRTHVADAAGDQAYGDINLLSPHGRLGRVRYVGYSAGLGLLITLLIGIAAVLTLGPSGDPNAANAAIMVGLVGYAAIIVVHLWLTIQRAHDMNMTGWISVIIFVPLAAFVFWFAPGTKGENDYGLQPPPNTIVTILFACILPLLFIVGMLAAIAIPAYQDYTIRAQVSEGLSLAGGPQIAVAEVFERLDAAPVDRLAAGLPAAATDTAGRYVASVDVAQGTILITYATSANSMIAGTVLALQPYVLPDDNVVWRCGEAAAPSGAVAMDEGAITSALATDIEARYLPSVCRP